MPDTPAIVLRRAGPERLELVRELLQLFLHDLSRHLAPGELPLDERGRYSWGIDASAWIVEEGRSAWVLEHAGHVVGLLLLSDVLRLSDGPGTSIDACFVLPPWRRRGVGRAVWRELAARWPGYWELATLATNAEGGGFADAGWAEIRRDRWGEGTVIEDGEVVRVRWLRVDEHTFGRADDGHQAGEVEAEGAGADKRLGLAGFEHRGELGDAGPVGQAAGAERDHR